MATGERSKCMNLCLYCIFIARRWVKAHSSSLSVHIHQNECWYKHIRDCFLSESHRIISIVRITISMRFHKTSTMKGCPLVTTLGALDNRASLMVLRSRAFMSGSRALLDRNRRQTHSQVSRSMITCSGPPPRPPFSPSSVPASASWGLK